MSATPLEYSRPIFEERQRPRVGKAMRIFSVVTLALGVVAWAVLFKMFRTPLIRVAAGMILVGGIASFSLPYLVLTQMITRVDGEGVHIRFGIFPWRTIAASTIADVEPCTYDAFKEFNGYGMRLRQKVVGDCYTISGDQGVRLTLRNDPKVLIGTQQPDALTAALRSVIVSPP
jgi:hypothetical protein